MEPTGTETEPQTGTPTTESGKQRKDFWEKVSEIIGQRTGCPLNNGWQPRNFTSQNLAFPADQVPLQAACKSRDEVVEMRLIIRDDRLLFESLAVERGEVQSVLEELFDGEGEFEAEWISPDETDASRERGKIIWRRSIILSEESSRQECAQWVVEAGEVFYQVFTTQFDVSSLSSS